MVPFMATSNFNLRGLSSEVMMSLKKEASRAHTSVNSLILGMIEHQLGFSKTRPRPIFKDLDHLAGTWSSSDAESFQKATQYFEQIDTELWNK
jgi:hypothetical protein